MSNLDTGKNRTFTPDKNDPLNQPWFAFFAQVKKLAARLDELEQVGTEKAEEGQL